jgi:hypothetical protein
MAGARAIFWVVLFVAGIGHAGPVLPRLVRFDSMGASITLVALLERVDEGSPGVVAP